MNFNFLELLEVTVYDLLPKLPSFLLALESSMQLPNFAHINQSLRDQKFFLVSIYEKLCLRLQHLYNKLHQYPQLFLGWLALADDIFHPSITLSICKELFFLIYFLLLLIFFSQFAIFSVKFSNSLNFL